VLRFEVNTPRWARRWRQFFTDKERVRDYRHVDTVF
jgi:hypothetical protein